MAQFTEIKHPDIEGHTARVAESAVARLAEAGWERVEPPVEPTSEPATEDVAPAVAPVPAPVAADTPAPKAKPSK